MDGVGSVRPRGLWNTAWAAEVAARRVGAGLTQQQVWTRAGIARSTYTKFETDRTTLTVDQLGAIADAIGVPIDELAHGVRMRRERDLADTDDPSLSSDVTAQRLAVLVERLGEASPATLERMCTELEALIADNTGRVRADRGAQLPVVAVPDEDVALLIHSARTTPRRGGVHGTPST